MREEELIVYKEPKEGTILGDMVWLIDHYRSGDGRSRPLFYDCMHSLLEMAAQHGFSGNLWHCYLTDLLVNNENSYSMACEMRGKWKAVSTSWCCTTLRSTRSFLILISRK